ncbi:MAG: ATP-binding cassette domain-containing protein [Anaerolineae bacterium]|nr:ATP-binding cassette domain-containing protein [Gemmatimonadaceae bacterium]
MEFSARSDGYVSGGVALELCHIAKRFGDLEALADASLRVLRGSVHALLGENGAGKTTLMRVAFGMVPPDAGKMFIDGSPARLSSPRQAIRLGIGMVHQRFTIVGAMSVAENVALGGNGSFRLADAADRVRSIGSETGLVLQPEALASTLPASGQQRLEIVKALAHGARTLILDEPTGVLAPAEVEDLMRFLRSYADGGGAVVLITHKLREAIGIADEVTVLRAGRTVAVVSSTAVTESMLAQAMMGSPGTGAEGYGAQLADAPIGAEWAAPQRQSAPAGGDSRHPNYATVIARTHNLRIASEAGLVSVREVSVTIRVGEILGIAGVEGAGYRELLRALAGIADPQGGLLELPDRIAFIPELSQREGLVMEMSLLENLALKGAGVSGKPPLRRVSIAAARQQLEGFSVRPASPWAAAWTLSGGNQQKLVLARELWGEPDLIVAENPTRGLDIMATAAVHGHLRAAASRGAGVVFHSVDVDELLTLASRVVVMFAGTLAEVPHDRAAVGVAMLGIV